MPTPPQSPIPNPQSPRASLLTASVNAPPFPDRIADESIRPHAPSIERFVRPLFDEQKALGLVHWKVTEDGKLSANVVCGDLADDQKPSLAQMVSESIAQQSTLSKLMPSASGAHSIASPLMRLLKEPHPPSPSPSPNPTLRGEVITVVFQERPKHQNQACIRQQQVDLIAAHLSIHQLQEDFSSDSSGPIRQTWWATTKQFLSENRKKWRTYALAAGVIALVGICPWKHSIEARVICEPAIRRFVSAPFDAKVLTSNVKPGDRVSKDQVLASLDGSDLRTKIAALQAKYEQAAQRQSAALSTGDATNVAIEQLEVQHLHSEIELLQDHQRRLQVRAPIDGIIISGDLERAAGATMGVGETIYEIATLENMIAEIAIPESEIAFTDSAGAVEITVEALPGKRQTTSLERIHPRSEIIDSNSVYVGEAQLPNDEGQLRPGMKGLASIHVGYRPIAWLLLHKPYEALRGWMGW